MTIASHDAARQVRNRRDCKTVLIGQDYAIQCYGHVSEQILYKATQRRLPGTSTDRNKADKELYGGRPLKACK